MRFIPQRAEILHQLAANAIAEAEINLLHSTTTIGRAKQTKKQVGSHVK